MTHKEPNAAPAHVRELRSASASPDVRVSNAANTLVLNMALGLGGRVKEVAGTKVEKSPEEKEVSEAIAARERLEAFLEEARENGWEAWQEVLRRIKAYQEQYPLFMTQFPAAHTGRMFMAKDQSWFVSVRGQSGSGSYEIQKQAYRKAEAA